MDAKHYMGYSQNWTDKLSKAHTYATRKYKCQQLYNIIMFSI